MRIVPSIIVYPSITEWLNNKLNTLLKDPTLLTLEKVLKFKLFWFPV
jgi:hypothetical protein